MKKKIKDLTFFDLTKICDKSKFCDLCPLCLDINGGYDKKCILNILSNEFRVWWPTIIEQEVDI